MSKVDPVDVLLVEDNPDERELTLRGLKKRTFDGSIATVGDGSEALDFLFCRGDYTHRRDEESPRLVLLDLNLPKVNGLEVLKQIKAHEETKGIPVVILSSSEDERDIAESYRLGANSYMVKPADFEQFVKRISDVGFYWLKCNRLPR